MIAGMIMALNAPRTRSLGQMAMDAIRRNGGTALFFSTDLPILVDGQPIYFT